MGGMMPKVFGFRRFAWWAMAGALAAVAVVVVFSRSPDEPAPTSPTDGGSTPEATALAAAVAQIDEDSRRPVVRPPVQAAPLPDTDDGPPPLASLVRGQPAEPYAVVGFAGEMAKAPMANPGRAGEPPDDALDWLGSATSFDTLAMQARASGRGWSFGWLRLASGARRVELAEALAELDAGIVGAAGRLLRVRLPADEALLTAIEALPGVDSLGAMPAAAKLRAFEDPHAQPPSDDPLPVFVTLMADDADGRWGRELTTLGAVVGRYDPDIRVYAANVARAGLDALAAADFVLAVEPIGVAMPAHDTSVPAMGADALRMHARSPGVFGGIGGASVPIGVMDTGLNVNHPDIAEHRASICGTNFVWSAPGRNDADLWVDAQYHGTHVTGTLVGNGYLAPRFAGMAPAVKDIRVAKVLSYDDGEGSSDSILRGMDFLADETSCGDGDAARPLIVNMSLSARSPFFDGRGTGARKLDGTVWTHRQLYVVAQANAGEEGFSNYAAAKNSLSVGAVVDDGHVWTHSSHGPTYDGRLAPQVVATGVGVCSAEGNGKGAGYDCRTGTSMAAPAVAGAAALLMDADPDYRSRPALARARLMASAIRPDVWLDNAAAFPTTNTGGPGDLQAEYGMGKVSARIAVLDRDRTDGWAGGAVVADVADEDEYAFTDITVPAGASRLDVVMTWDEPPSEAIATPVLNDLDLWLDADADCNDGPCGEQSSTSRIDNVEWIVLRNPEPGTYRVKVVPRRIYTAPPRAAVSWTVIRGSSTPELSMAVEQTPLETGEERRLQVSVDVSADAYVAAGVRLHLDCRGEGSDCDALTVAGGTAQREDGLSAQVSDVDEDTLRNERRSPIEMATGISLGEIAAGETQAVALDVVYAGTSPVHLYLMASAWNGHGTSRAITVSPPDAADADAGDPVGRPANDRFADAAPLVGGEGTIPVDLVRATPEPGEPGIGPDDGRPLGSLWYEWTAPSTDLVRFGTESAGTAPTDARLDVYQGGHVAGLDHIVSNRHVELLGVTSRGVSEFRTLITDAVFLAQAGETFRIRVARGGPSAPLVLRWHQGPRPGNDDFTDAAALAGTEGSVDGTNLGATLESGESLGPLSATTWYRWTAPENGAWRFEVDSVHVLRVAAFTGGGVGNLRLVSGYPDTAASFKARGGDEYRIAVASRDAYVSSGSYGLAWEKAQWTPAHGDDFAGGTIGQETSIDLTRHTVEPGEPEASGVRTRWWSWTAPDTARFTWKLDSIRTELTVAAFRGDSLDSLELVAGTGADVTAREFSFDAEEGERYRISVGWPAGDYGAYVGTGARGEIKVSPTPPNDEFAGALALGSTRGLTRASNYYATTAPGELAEQLGHSSLWWTYAAPTPGWYTFHTTGDQPALAVFEVGDDGTLREISRDREGRLLFRAEAGRRYAIRASTPDQESGGAFSLHWEATEAPAWLRYLGSFAETADAGGMAMQLIDAGGLAFNADGSVLYAASADGLAVFGRDRDSGALATGETIADDVAGSLLIHDAKRDRLIANRCGTWRVYTGLGDADGIEAGDLTVEGDPANCGRRLFLAPDGGFLYRSARAEGIDVFAVEDGALRHRQTGPVGYDAVVAPNGTLFTANAETDRRLRFNVRTGRFSWIYVWGIRIAAYGHDSESGRLVFQKSVWKDGDPSPMLAIVDDHGLFTTSETSGHTRMYERKDFRLVGEVRFPHGPSDPPFEFAAARADASAVDVFGTDVAVGLEVEQGEVDLLANGQTDRFGNRLPLFGRPNGLAASPDGRHLYLATYQHGIVAFERVGAGVEPADPHVRLDILEVSAGSISFAAEKDSDGCIAVDGLDHDEIAYTVLNSKWQWRPNADWPWTDVADTRTTGEFCPHAPDAPGHYRLVADVSVDGETRQHASNILVQDDHGDSIDDATPVGVPSTTEGWLDPEDEDYFRIELDTAGELTVRSEGWINAEGHLLDAEGETIASASGEDYNFRMVRDLDAGTYYVRVDEKFSRPGAYAVRVEFDADEPDLVVTDAIFSAVPTVGESFTLSAVVRNEGDAASVATTLRYYRSDDDVISDSDEEIGTEAIVSIGRGEFSEHSIEVTVTAEGSHYGACVDAVENESDSTNNCSESAVPDDHGDDFDTAWRVPVPSTTEADLTRGDRDFFRFEIDATTTVTVETKSSIDTFGSLFDGDQTHLANNDDSGTGSNFRIRREIDAGTYYVRVRGYSSSTTGAYELTISSQSASGNAQGDRTH